jgi:oligopeptidase A
MAAPFLTQDFHIRWSTLTPEHIEADIRAALEKAQASLDALIDQDRGKMNFDSVVLGLDECTRELNEAWGLVTHLDSLCNSPALREAHNKMLPEVSAFFAKIPLNEHLWDLLVTYSKTEEAKKLRRCASVRSMRRWKASSRPAPTCRRTRKSASRRSSRNSPSTRRSTRRTCSTRRTSGNCSSTTWIVSKGCRKSAIEAARADAVAKGLGTPEKPVYRFHLEGSLHDSGHGIPRRRGHPPSGLGGLLRHRTRWRARQHRDLVWKILRLRHEKAQIMGKANFADHVLTHRMAKTGQQRPAFHRLTCISA